MKKIYPEERIVRIMEIIKANRKVTVDELTQLFDVTGATIRSDLRELEIKQLITRTHGGALLKQSIGETIFQEHDSPYERRLTKNNKLKEAIGRATANYLNDGDSIMLDDGSTTLQVAKNLDPKKNVHIVTNGLNICTELLAHPNTQVICTGGILNREDLSYYGKVAEEVTRRFNTTRAVLGASGISLEHGITTPAERKADLKKIMFEHSDELIIVADHTKLNRITLIPVCLLGEVRLIITDSLAPEEMVASIRELGVKVLLAEV